MEKTEGAFWKSKGYQDMKRLLKKSVDYFVERAHELEGRFYPSRVELQGFPTSIQLDAYSCGPQCTYAILQYFKKRCAEEEVEEALETESDGTDPWAIRRVLREYKLKYESLTPISMKSLERAIDRGRPVLISIDDDDHYSVVKGYSDTAISWMNPSLNVLGNGSLWSWISREDFMERWDKWGLVISKARKQK